MWRRSGTALSQRLALSEEVAEALYGRLKKPVVALESTIISHGMPFPQNLEMATHVEDIVRAHGACPATICIADGSLKVGLSKEDLNQLAELGAAAKKCSTRDIAAAVTDKSVVGATTVSSTMYVPTLQCVNDERLLCIYWTGVFVTGGIGGVHRFCEETMGIRPPLIPATQTAVVPVIGYQTDQFPAFFTQDSGEKAHLRRDTPQDVARLIHESAALELPNGHIIAVPNPKPVPTEMINNAIELGLKEVVEKHISGQAVTPYLLKRVNEITQGVSLGSNIDLVNSNATVGSQVGAAPSNVWFAVNLTMPLGVSVWFEPTSVQKALRVVEGDAVSAITYMSPNADELHAIGIAIRQKPKEVDASPSHTSAHEHFPLTKESCIIPKERMTRLKDDLITGTWWCMFSFLSLIVTCAQAD
ncbi:hypothetical protein BBJ28_00008479 [Nothophytophthora sp. Chile5]|nr:hypothetical protein BBJ28_00008479 [Nothophytophthora sp. Chile5]